MEKRGLKKEQKEEMEFVNRGLEWLESGKDIRLGEWSAKDIEYINQYLPISAKPVVSTWASIHVVTYIRGGKEREMCCDSTIVAAKVYAQASICSTCYNYRYI